MGAGENADEQSIALAHELGHRIAAEGWVVLSGGRDVGVMAAVNAGAKEIPNSLTVGILPTADTPASPNVDIVIKTDMGQARNNINVLSSDVVVAVGNGGPGTVSEIALALKANKRVILLGASQTVIAFFRELGKDHIWIAETAEETIRVIKQQ